MSEYYECECGRRIPCDEMDTEEPRCPECGKALAFEDHETDVDGEDAEPIKAAKKAVKARSADVRFRIFLLIIIILAGVATGLRVVSLYHFVWIGRPAPFAIRKDAPRLGETFYRLSAIKERIAEDRASRLEYPESLLSGLRNAGLLHDAQAPETREVRENEEDIVDNAGE